MNMHPRVRTAIISGTTLVVGLYLTLAFVAMFCVTAHAGHHGHMTHSSPLCSWACQANNSSSLITLMTPAVPLLLFLSLLVFTPVVVPTPKRARVSTRAPPRTHI